MTNDIWNDNTDIQYDLAESYLSAVAAGDLIMIARRSGAEFQKSLWQRYRYVLMRRDLIEQYVARRGG